MKTQSDEQEAAREAGSRYGTMAADLSLIHISTATTEEKMQKYIADLAHKIREQAVQRAREGLGEDLAAIWKDAALRAAHARLEGYTEPKEP